MAYILNWRMMKAYNLIKYSNANLEHAAEQVSFASARTLSKAFHGQFAVMPTE
ncbi:MAG: transcriptional regulator GlxA family with amidase domain [Glaciecola sp.]|jgi:transcriptional regulator GlxA family with amidase domain